MTVKTEKRPVPHIVGEFNPALYKYAIKIEIGYHPETIVADNFYQHNPGYKEFKFMHLPTDRAAKFKRIIDGIGIWDYFLFRNDRKIDIYFRHEEERLAAKIGLMPEGPQKSRFIHCPADTSNRALRNMRRELKEQFLQTETGTKAKFLIDRRNKVISVKTNNGHDFIQFMKDSATLRGTVFPIPRDSNTCETRAKRYAPSHPAAAHEFNASALPPELGFELSYPRDNIPLPSSRRLPMEERVRSCFGAFYISPS